MDRKLSNNAKGMLGTLRKWQCYQPAPGTATSLAMEELVAKSYAHRVPGDRQGEFKYFPGKASA